MSGERKALIVANDEYEQEALRDLMAPAADADALEQVLGDPQIGEFTVQVVRNQPSYVIQAQIEELFTESLPDDVLLVHFSGHGLKNQSGEWFFAASNTRPRLLGATAVSADFVHRCMRASRSRSIVLFLDCCYGGAFAQGVAVRASGDVNVLDSFPQERAGGRGRAVITASNAMEYAFEGDRLADNQQPSPSVFTSALVEGLATGDADRDEDGWVSLNELYDYVFEKVRLRNPHQTPSRAVEMQGELYVARSKRRRIHPAPLPPGLAAAIADPNMYTRLGAVSELRTRVFSDDLPTALGAYLALATLARTDSEYVAQPAAEAASLAVIQPEQTALRFGECEQGSEAPRRAVRLLGPPIARFCTPHASEGWIHVTETAEGFDVSVDTSGTGSLDGSLELKGPVGEAVIAVEVQLIAPEPERPDAGPPDAGPPDGEPPDGEPPDGEPPDGEPPDAGPSDGEPPDAGPSDAKPPDAGSPDAGSPDAGPSDGGPSDGGPSDGGPPDAESPGGEPSEQADSAQGAGSADDSSAPAETPPAGPEGTTGTPPGTGGQEPQRGARSILRVGRPVHAVAFSPDGALLATAGHGVLRIWEVRSAAVVREVPIERRCTVSALAFSPDGARLVGVTGQAVRVWDASAGRQQQELTFRSQVLAAAFSPDGTRLAIGGSDGYARICDAATGQRQQQVPREVPARSAPGVMASQPLTPIPDKADAAAFSPDGTRLAIASHGVVRIWDLPAASVIRKMPLKGRDPVSVLVFSPDGARLAGATGQSVRIWDASTGERQREVMLRGSPVLAVAFSPDGTRLATSTYRHAQIWDATSGRPEFYKAHDEYCSVFAVTFSPDGTLIATGGSDETARIWDIADGT